LDFVTATANSNSKQQQQTGKNKGGCATHMRNDDTPSLGGWCLERSRFPGGNPYRSNHLQRQRFRLETGRFQPETFTTEVAVAEAVLDMQDRLRQRIGRPSRVRSIAIRFTEDEARELEKEATARGTTVREWARESLLREARRADGDALFTELVATRMLMVNLFKPLITGKPVSPEWVTEVMAAVRKEKRKAALEVRQQYTEDKAGGR
jgi:hypothetical protein